MTKKHNFEDALKRLEEIVAQIENGDTPLHNLLKLYEEGSALIKFCLLQLESAEKKVSLLSGKSEGDFKLEPLDE